MQRMKALHSLAYHSCCTHGLNRFHSRKALVYVEFRSHTSPECMSLLLARELNNSMNKFGITQPLAIYVNCATHIPPLDFISKMQDLFVYDQTAKIEFTLEIDPNLLMPFTESLAEFQNVGVNRICLPIADNLLNAEKNIGKIKFSKGNRSLGLAVDITLPCFCAGENMDTWITSLGYIANCSVSHIKLEEVFCQRCTDAGKMDSWFMTHYHAVRNVLGNLGFHEYKFCYFTDALVSDYIWRMSLGCQYIGIGPGSHGRLYDCRSGFKINYINHRSPDGWANAVLKCSEGVSSSKPLTKFDCLTELLIHGLDTLEGVTAESWMKYSNGLSLLQLKNIAPIKTYVADGVLQVTEHSLVIPRRYWCVSNSIIVTILNSIEERIV